MGCKTLSICKKGQFESYKTSEVTKGWLPGHNSYEPRKEIINNLVTKRKAQVFWDTYVRAIHIITRTLAENEVKIMAGTNAETQITVPGFSIYDDLESLNNTGLGTAEILASTTSIPAEWMQFQTGKVVVGFEADLLLLYNNPLETIGNTKSIEAVIYDGRILDRSTLDLMLQQVKDINDTERTIDIDVFLIG